MGSQKSRNGSVTGKALLAGEKRREQDLIDSATVGTALIGVILTSDRGLREDIT